jgi:hypothetical protein
VVVDNRPSAGGTIASEYVLAAYPDGPTLMMVSTAHAGNATLYSKLSFDTVKDFAGISQVASVPNVLVVAPALGALAVGLAVERGIRRGGDVTVSYRAAALGAVVVALIGLVPIGGSVVKIVVALVGAGAAARVAARRLRGDSWTIEKVLGRWGGAAKS